MHRASGKAVLAHLASARKDEIIDRNLFGREPAERELARAALEEELALVRERGWALDDEESEHGITGIGAPVFAASGDAYGAVGLVTPTFRMQRSADGFVAAVMAAARKASKVLVRAAVS
jgi:IclR family transcriptional regulator, acetate operon repressor